MDEAVTFFGIQLEAKLEAAGHKETKEERKVKAARERVLNTILGDEEVESQSFADPAAMFM